MPLSTEPSRRNWRSDNSWVGVDGVLYQRQAASQGKLRFAPLWRDRALQLVKIASGYYWFTTDRGNLFNDPDPTQELIDPDYQYESFLVFSYNQHRLANGLEPSSMATMPWFISKQDFGFTQDELTVIRWTASMDTQAYTQCSAGNYPTTCSWTAKAMAKAADKCWSAWLRDKLEAALLD